MHHHFAFTCYLSLPWFCPIHNRVGVFFHHSGSGSFNRKRCQKNKTKNNCTWILIFVLQISGVTLKSSNDVSFSLQPVHWQCKHTESWIGRRIITAESNWGWSHHVHCSNLRRVTMTDKKKLMICHFFSSYMFYRPLSRSQRCVIHYIPHCRAVKVD